MEKCSRTQYCSNENINSSFEDLPSVTPGVELTGLTDAETVTLTTGDPKQRL
jgi:hypothetical protein